MCQVCSSSCPSWWRHESHAIPIMTLKQSVCYGGHWGHWVWVQLPINSTCHSQWIF
jgi:hypothetical protein